MITVLLPAYNAEKYIKRAIDSVLTQTFTDFELLIVNDGSTDATQEMIVSYSDPRIRLVNMAHNMGLVEALNHGLTLAKGEYIARMDADDISLPTRFAKQVKFLENNPDYIACGTGIINFNETLESYLEYPQSDEKIRIALTFFERNICHPTVMLRKSIIDEHAIVYRDDYPHAEDYTLWIDLALHGKLANLKEGLLKYYKHSEQISCKHQDEQIETSRRIVSESLAKIWGKDQSHYVDDVVLLCVHQFGKFPSVKLDRKQADHALNMVVNWNHESQVFDELHLRKLLHFKKLRCSFYYGYSFVAKMRNFIEYSMLEPKASLLELRMFMRLFLLRMIKP